MINNEILRRKHEGGVKLILKKVMRLSPPFRLSATGYMRQYKQVG